MAITFVEIFSGAALPFEDLATNTDVLIAVCEKGLRPSRPSDMPMDLFEVVQACWKQEPGDRISASAALARIDALFQDSDSSDSESTVSPQHQLRPHNTGDSIVTIQSSESEYSSSIPISAPASLAPAGSLDDVVAPPLESEYSTSIPPRSVSVPLGEADNEMADNESSGTYSNNLAKNGSRSVGDNRTYSNNLAKNGSRSVGDNVTYSSNITARGEPTLDDVADETAEAKSKPNSHGIYSTNITPRAKAADIDLGAKEESLTDDELTDDSSSSSQSDSDSTTSTPSKGTDEVADNANQTYATQIVH
jgi:Protein tyrosine and serine/threonine kinase